MIKWRTALILIGIAALFARPAAAQSSGEFVPGRCPMSIPADYVVDCGVLTVPLRHENPDGPTIDLAVAILRTASPEPFPDPVLYLSGGPGDGALYSISQWVGHPVTRDRDLILLDQRGTGYGAPRLSCYEFSFDRDVVGTVRYYAACAKAMTDAGIDRSAYTSAQSAQDVELLARTLGYDQLNLYGVSYGTRLALTIMRDAPEIVRSAVLDSPYPPQINGQELHVVNAYDAIDSVLAACEEDASCGTAFPDLRARFYAWVETRDRVSRANGIEIDGERAAQELFDVLYETSSIPYVPLALSNLLNGDPALFGALMDGPYTANLAAPLRLSQLSTWADTLASKQLDLPLLGGMYERREAMSMEERADLYEQALIAADDADYLEIVRIQMSFGSVEDTQRYLDTLSNEAFNRVFENTVTALAFGLVPVPYADGVRQSVTCIEEVPFSSKNTADTISRRVPRLIRVALMELVNWKFEACRGWGVDRADPIENATVHSDIPALILNGQFDPVTPAIFADAAREGLTQAQTAVIPGGGHGMYLIGGCPAEIGAAFLDNPTAPLDTSCVSAMRVRWVTR